MKKAIDFKKLNNILGEALSEEKEVYEFTWPGKRDALAEARKSTRKTLRPAKNESINWDRTENLYIEGDNLEVLKVIQESYLGKVKMIYIDPPYNTGSDLIYNDNFESDTSDYLKSSSIIDDENNRLVKNVDTNGRFHSDWCSMIYPRLALARNLLTDDGVIFISIDENEVSTMKMICDEVFGEKNFIAELIWSGGRKNDSKYVSVSHEYILCYFKNIEGIKDKKIVWREKKKGLDQIYDQVNELKNKYGKDYQRIEKELKDWFKQLAPGNPSKDHSHYNHVDDRGVFFPSDISWPGGGGPKYEILHPITHKPVKIPSRGWLTQESTMKKWIAEGRVDFGETEEKVPTIKSYLEDKEYTVPYSVIYKDGRASSKRLAVLMGEKVFENPKDEEILERLIEFSGVSNNDIVMDFFSGSASTAHAVINSNVKNNTNISFIMVQIPEIIDPKRAKTERSKKVALSAIKLLDSISVPHTIAEIGKERIRRVGKGLENSKVDFGFRVFKLSDSNMKEIYYSPEKYRQDFLSMVESNIKEDRDDLDLLFGCLLDWGLELTKSYESEIIHGIPIHTYDNDALVACFADDISEDVVREIAKRQPLRAVFRDSSFVNDTARVNLGEIFKLLSPDTDVKVL